LNRIWDIEVRQLTAPTGCFFILKNVSTLSQDVSGETPGKVFSATLI
jgi:hypothetical protein